MSMIKSNFSKAIIFRSKGWYFAIKWMFILAVFLPSNVTVSISCKQGEVKCEHYLVVPLHFV